ncbi:unnamed protein product [marine sediment metagenome]|uniref:Uncharacterized protein n=1 Tax=marine sediment metagenome TaxID=412755 RepID=X0WNN1_9ZZZZ
MANFFVKNSLSNLSVKFNISLRYFVVKGQEGDHLWILELGTVHKDADGNPISAKKINNISAGNLDEVIEIALADLCALIDWSPLVEDKRAPFVDDFFPAGSDVPISSNVSLVIKDKLPSAGIDLSNMKIILNNSVQDFDITDEIELVDFYYSECALKWITPLRVYDTYD